MARERCNPVCRELKNDFTKGVDSVPLTVKIIYCLLQIYQFEPKKNPPKGNNAKKSKDEVKDTENSKSKFHGHSFQQRDFK